MNDTAQKPSDQTVKPATPISSPTSHEHEPAAFPDITKMTESDIRKEEKELERQIEAIAEKSPIDQQPILDEEIKRVGVALSEEGINEPAISVGEQPLSMSYAQAKETRKKYNWKNSVAWLATLIMYHWKKISAKGGSASGGK